MATDLKIISGLQKFQIIHWYLTIEKNNAGHSRANAFKKNDLVSFTWQCRVSTQI